jgi:transcriptional accessory protein Tex/SPT6
LSVDPGYRAGCKCALLNHDGSLLFPDNISQSLFTLYPLQNYENAVGDLVQKLNDLFVQQRSSSSSSSFSSKLLLQPQQQQQMSVRIALGDGHGSLDARKLVEDALIRLNGMPVAQDHHKKKKHDDDGNSIIAAKKDDLKPPTIEV